MKQDEKTQIKTILTAMLHNPDKIWWYASDFQSSPYFVGYEASARMSDIKRQYDDDLVISSNDGRYRILRINWENKDTIKAVKEKYSIR